MRVFDAFDALFGRLPGRLSYLTVAGSTVFATLSGTSNGQHRDARRADGSGDVAPRLQAAHVDGPDSRHGRARGNKIEPIAVAARTQG